MSMHASSSSSSLSSNGALLCCVWLCVFPLCVLLLNSLEESTVVCVGGGRRISEVFRRRCVTRSFFVSCSPRHGLTASSHTTRGVVDSLSPPKGFITDFSRNVISHAVFPARLFDVSHSAHLFDEFCVNSLLQRAHFLSWISLLCAPCALVNHRAQYTSSIFLLPVLRVVIGCAMLYLSFLSRQYFYGSLALQSLHKRVSVSHVVLCTMWRMLNQRHTHTTT